MPLAVPLVEKSCRSRSRNDRQWQSSGQEDSVKRALLFVVASAFALTACSTNTSQNAAQEQKAGTDIGIDPSWMDKSVVPGDDFFG
jgi:predicted small secreted protein